MFEKTEVIHSKNYMQILHMYIKQPNYIHIYIYGD
jgi:hypothetical protein